MSSSLGQDCRHDCASERRQLERRMDWLEKRVSQLDVTTMDLDTKLFIGACVVIVALAWSARFPA